MAWKIFIFLEKILRVESSQMLGLKNENIVKIEWIKLKFKRMKWRRILHFLMCNNLLLAKNGISDTKMMVLKPILSEIRCVTNCYTLKIA